MSATDYLLDLALIGLVFLQIRGRRLTSRSLVLPIVIVAVVAQRYLKSIPTSGNDVILIAVCAGVGVALGAGAGLATRVCRRDGVVFARAGVVAAVLWVLGVGFRFAFQEYATHGGGENIYRFSTDHAITVAGAADAWVAALVLMALGEVLARTFVLAARAYRVHPGFFSDARQPAIMGIGDPR
jgi:hypothetical protein